MYLRLSRLTVLTLAAHLTLASALDVYYTKKCTNQLIGGNPEIDAKTYIRQGHTLMTATTDATPRKNACELACTENVRCAFYQVARTTSTAQSSSECDLFIDSENYNNALSYMIRDLQWEHYSGSDLSSVCGVQTGFCHGDTDEDCNAEGVYLKHIIHERGVISNPQCSESIESLRAKPACLRPEAHAVIAGSWTFEIARDAVSNAESSSQACSDYTAKKTLIENCLAMTTQNGYVIDPSHFLTTAVTESSVPLHCKMAYHGHCYVHMDQQSSGVNGVSTCCQNYREFLKTAGGVEKNFWTSSISTCSMFFSSDIMNVLQGGPRCTRDASTKQSVIDAKLSPATRTSTPLYTVAAASVLTYLLSAIVGDVRQP